MYPNDARLTLLCLSSGGRALMDELRPNALRLTEETLAPLAQAERAMLLYLLEKIS